MSNLSSIQLMLNFLASWGESLFNSLVTSQSCELPMTGGDGPMLVTVVGLSLAGLSLVILFLRARSSKKSKGKQRQ